MSGSGDAPSLRVMLEQTRVSRAAVGRGLILCPDSLHMVLRCPRCAEINHDLRIFEGRLQLAAGGRRPCATLADLHATLERQLTHLQFEDPIDPCRCGTLGARLTLMGARLYHAVPGSGFDLVLEYQAHGTEPMSARMGRMPPGGAIGWVESLDDTAALGLLGMPVLLRPLWEAVISSPEGAVAAVDEGLSLVSFAADDAAIQAELTRALASDEDLRLHGLSQRVLLEQHWSWLPKHPAIVTSPTRVLALLLRYDVLTLRIAALAASLGVTVSRAGSQLELADGLCATPVDLTVVAEAGFGAMLSLASMAAHTVQSAALRLQAQRELLAEIKRLRPHVSLRREGYQWRATAEGRDLGKPLDLLSWAASLASHDDFERDLAFYLEERSPWSSPWHVCACGAHRLLTLRWLRSTDVDAGTWLYERIDATWAMVWSLECDRHVDAALRALAETEGLSHEAARVRALRDAEALSFELSITEIREPEAKGAQVLRGRGLAQALCLPTLARGLARAATALDTGEFRLWALDRDTVVLTSSEVDAEVEARLGEAVTVSGALQGHEALKMGVKTAVELEGAAAGRFRCTSTRETAAPRAHRGEWSAALQEGRVIE